MRGMRARRAFQRVAPLAAAIAVFWVAVASADQLLDRVVARVGDDAITLTDVRAAIGFGIVDPGAAPDPERAALAQLIDRRLELAEIPRAQPEPDDTSVEAELARMKQHAGPKASDAHGDNGRGRRAAARPLPRHAAPSDLSRKPVSECAGQRCRGREILSSAPGCVRSEVLRAGCGRCARGGCRGTPKDANRSVAHGPEKRGRGRDYDAPIIATRSTSSELNPAWQTTGATLLRRRR